MTDTIASGEKWAKAHSIACFCVFLFYMLWKLNFYLAQNIHNTYYMTAAIILVAFCVYYRRFWAGRYVRLLMIFWLWLVLTRILNGDKTLSDNYYLIIPLALCFCFLAVGMSLTEKQKERFLDWFSFAVGFFYVVTGGICIFCMLSGKTVINPVTGANLANAALLEEGRVTRLSLLDYHSNITAAIFFVPLSLMVYQFFHCRSKLWRIPIGMAYLEFYLCIGLTFSRSIMGAVSVCMAMVVILIVLQRMPRERRAMKALTVVLLAALVVPLMYKSFSWSTAAMGKATALFREKEINITEPTETNERQKTIVFSDLKTWKENQEELPALTEISGNLFEDNRSLENDIKTLHSRKALYEAVLLAYKEEPLCMLIGSNNGNMLRYANMIFMGDTYYEGVNLYQHMHNFLLQVLMMTGIPGFLLVLAFCVLLMIRMVKLYFSESATMAEKTLVLPLAGLLIHFMLEVGLFTSVDVRSLFFFLMAGFVIGFDREGMIAQADRKEGCAE